MRSLKGLRYKALVGADVEYTTLDFYTPCYLYLSTQNTSTGNAVKNANTNYSWVNENTLTYDKKINAIMSSMPSAGSPSRYFSRVPLAGRRMDSSRTIWARII